MAHFARAAACVLILNAACEAAFVHAPGVPPRDGESDVSSTEHWSLDWVDLFHRGARSVGLNETSPTILAALSARLRDPEFGRAAVRSLASVASGSSPQWKQHDGSWSANWTSWDLNSTTFQQPARFSGCTDYGLLGLRLLQRDGFDLDSAWTAQEAARYKHMQQALCYVWVRNLRFSTFLQNRVSWWLYPQWCDVQQTHIDTVASLPVHGTRERGLGSVQVS
jgi:hypothetical protein